MSSFDESIPVGAIAIIGMSGRFPGAKDMDEFWQNLYNGVESVKFFNREELIKMGIDEHLLDNPKFVAADAILDGMDEFDASFFDYSAREAEITDPQHRLFLESAWEVMESAGYNSELYNGRVSVYAGANLSGYMVRNICSNPDLVENVGMFKIMIANSQDFLATKVSYKMNLMGPSVNVNTLCSSSLVAVHMACQNLLSYGCDLALAGGVSFQISRNEAFFYQEGGIGAADGHCKAYDIKANGTVSGSGLAVVVLKRLEDAIADGDHIHAVIRGTGINNDGSSKNSYTAPNVDGQAECIAEAIAMSGVDPETITYIDGHGTGTNLGDPIEIAALTNVFRSYTPKKQFCAIGSVKTNIGHLVSAGGLASVIKTALAMKNRVIPASLNFEEPNPKIDFVNSPFYVNAERKKWETYGYPLRAGVSSFGIGGTNTHVILEEAPVLEDSEKSNRKYQLVSLSAKTATALEKMTSNLADYVRKNPSLKLEDVAFTLHVGRRNMDNRRALVCSDINELIEKLENPDTKNVLTRFQKSKEQPLVFMFPGEGSQYLNMGSEIYRTEAVFRETVDNCAEILRPLLGSDIRELLYGSGTEMKDYRSVRAAIFVTEYALAKLLTEMDIVPQYLAGEGVGEYVAACVAGVFSLEDALYVVSADDEYLHENLKKVEFNSLNIPFISCVTGSWIDESDAGSADYWIRQRTSTRFPEGLNEIAKDSDQILWEIGPGNRLTVKAKELANSEMQQNIISIMPDAGEEMSCDAYMLQSIGKYWLLGGKVNWNKLYTYEKRHRVPLPTYPFERQRYWIEPGKRQEVQQKPGKIINSRDDLTEKVLNSDFDEGSFTISLKLDKESLGKMDSTGRKAKLEEILKLKERLEAVCREYATDSYEIEVSSLGLKGGKAGELNESANGSGLSKMPRPALETPYIEPQTDTQKLIAELCQDVLGYEKLGINDDFFELGGHSLLAAAVITKLRKAFHRDISLQELFEYTTIAKLAEYFKEDADEYEDEEEIEEGQI